MPRTKSNIPFTPLQDIVRMYYQEELSANKIAEHVGRDTEAVLSRLRNGGYQLRSYSEAAKLAYQKGQAIPYDRHADRNDQEIIRFYCDEKLSVTQITEKIGRSYSAVLDRLHKNEITMRPKGESKLENIEKVKTLYFNEGISVPQIAKQFGCEKGRIYRCLAREGCTLRTSGESYKLLYQKGICVAKKGSEAYNWRGGKLPNSQGYILVYSPGHPKANNIGYVSEHLLVWEQYHQRQLPKGHIIHHLNGVKSDNRPKNLVAMPRAKHTTLVEPYKKHIRELEIENRQLRRALEDSQMIFYINEN